MMTKIEITGSDQEVAKVIRAYIAKQLQERHLDVHQVTKNGHNELWVNADLNDLWSIRNDMSLD
jgi:hypothetical protein